MRQCSFCCCIAFVCQLFSHGAKSNRVSVFYILILWILGNAAVVQPQKHAYQLNGKVVNETGGAIPFAVVYFPEEQLAPAFNIDSLFVLCYSDQFLISFFIG